jgi:hypothetical protein
MPGVFFILTQKSTCRGSVHRDHLLSRSVHWDPVKCSSFPSTTGNKKQIKDLTIYCNLARDPHLKHLNEEDALSSKICRKIYGIQVQISLPCRLKKQALPRRLYLYAQYKLRGVISQKHHGKMDERKNSWHWTKTRLWKKYAMFRKRLKE